MNADQRRRLSPDISADEDGGLFVGSSTAGTHDGEFAETGRQFGLCNDLDAASFAARFVVLRHQEVLSIAGGDILAFRAQLTRMS